MPDPIGIGASVKLALQLSNAIDWLGDLFGLGKVSYKGGGQPRPLSSQVSNLNQIEPGLGEALMFMEELNKLPEDQLALALSAIEQESGDQTLGEKIGELLPVLLPRNPNDPDRVGDPTTPGGLPDSGTGPGDALPYPGDPRPPADTGGQTGGEGEQQGPDAPDTNTPGIGDVLGDIIRGTDPSPGGVNIPLPGTDSSLPLPLVSGGSTGQQSSTSTSAAPAAPMMLPGYQQPWQIGAPTNDYQQLIAGLMQANRSKRIGGF